MATEQSERIRAALLRAKASRQSSNSPALESTEEPNTRPILDTSESGEAAVAEAEETSTEPSFEELAEENESEIPLHEQFEEVETTLPLVARSEEDRALLFHDEITSANPSPLAPEEDIQSPRLRIDTGVLGDHTRFPRNVLIVVGVIALAGLSIFFLKDHLWPAAKPTGTAASYPLQMQVESQGNGIINVRWNPQSSAVLQAREGRLVIAERDQQTRTIALSPEQLKIGHLYYQSPVERVEFRLEIVDRSGGVAKESVLALSSGVAAEPSAGPPIAPTQDEPRMESAKSSKAPPVHTQPESSRVVAKTTAAAKTLETQQPSPSRLPIRSFAPPPSQRKSDETRAVLLDDAPPVVPSGAAVPPPVSLPEAAVRIPAPQLKEPPAPQQLKTGGNLQTPKLVKRVTPAYPPAAQAANIQGKVRFTAMIGKDGTIQNVQVMSGPPVLIPAATAAVKKWVYEPMMLNGEPTEVITQIEVNFALHQ